MERVRDMFEQALQQVKLRNRRERSFRQAPIEFSKVLYLHYAKFEEDYGLAKHAMTIYDTAAKAVPIDQRMSVYEVYISKAIEFFGIGKVKKVFCRDWNGFRCERFSKAQLKHNRHMNCRTMIAKRCLCVLPLWNEILVKSIEQGRFIRKLHISQIHPKTSQNAKRLITEGTYLFSGVSGMSGMILKFGMEMKTLSERCVE